MRRPTFRWAPSGQRRRVDVTDRVGEIEDRRIVREMFLVNAPVGRRAVGHERLPRRCVKAPRLSGGDQPRAEPLWPLLRGHDASQQRRGPGDAVLRASSEGSSRASSADETLDFSGQLVHASRVDEGRRNRREGSTACSALVMLNKQPTSVSRGWPILVAQRLVTRADRIRPHAIMTHAPGGTRLVGGARRQAAAVLVRRRLRLHLGDPLAAIRLVHRCTRSRETQSSASASRSFVA